MIILGSKQNLNLWFLEQFIIDLNFKQTIQKILYVLNGKSIVDAIKLKLNL